MFSSSFSNRSFALLSVLALASPLASACGTAVGADENAESSAQAQTAYDACAQILQGDIVNKVVKSESTAASASDVLQRAILSESVSEAWSLYSSLYDAAARDSSSGGGSVNSIFFSASAGAGGDHSRKLSQSEFSQAYESLRTYNRDTLSQESVSSTSFVSNYASYVRDQATVHAWEACITRDAQPGLYAYGSRDDAGHPYVNVVWTPGPFAGVAPAIDVTFVKPAGLAIADESAATVAVGSGHSFTVTSVDADAAFDVAVNGALRDASGRVLGSFTSSAHVPARVHTSIVVPAGCSTGALRCDANVGERCNFVGGWDPAPDACILTCSDRGGAVCSGACVKLGTAQNCASCGDRCTGLERCKKVSDRTGRYRRMCLDTISL